MFHGVDAFPRAIMPRYYADVAHCVAGRTIVVLAMSAKYLHREDPDAN